MSEPLIEMNTGGNADFSLDNDPSKITRDQIKSYFNDGFMRGKVPQEEFIDSILNTANRNPVLAGTALHALVLSLGDLRYSGQMVNENTNDILSQGEENKFTQGVIQAMSPEHIKVLRQLHTQENSPPYASEAYLLSLLHSPRAADEEDVRVLSKELDGEPSSLFSPNKPGISTYYPRKLFEVMNTVQRIMEKRPELVDTALIASIRSLPERIKTGNLLRRPSYDRGIDRNELVDAAEKLQSIATKFEPTTS